MAKAVDLPIYSQEEFLLNDGVVNASPRVAKTAVETHSHDFFEIEYIYRGKGVHHLNGKDFPLHQGAAYLLTPADVHSLEVEEPMQIFNVQFSERLFHGNPLGMNLLQAQGTQLYLTVREEEIIQPLYFQVMEEARNRQPYSIPYIQGLTQCILILLLRKVESRDLQKAPNSIQQALMFIHRHFREPLTLDGIAAVAGLSPHYFCQVFHNATGVTVTRYLNNLRAQYARNLLVTENRSITDVCFESGFGSFASFSRAFRECHHATPLQIRKTGKQQP